MSATNKVAISTSEWHRHMVAIVTGGFGFQVQRKVVLNATHLVDTDTWSLDCLLSFLPSNHLPPMFHSSHVFTCSCSLLNHKCHPLPTPHTTHSHAHLQHKTVISKAFYFRSCSEVAVNFVFLKLTNKHFTNVYHWTRKCYSTNLLSILGCGYFARIEKRDSCLKSA